MEMYSILSQSQPLITIYHKKSQNFLKTHLKMYFIHQKRKNSFHH